MNRVHVLGFGTMAKGVDEPFSGGLAMLSALPIKDYTDPRASRRFGRLTKGIFIAAHRAFQDAGIDDAAEIPMAVATCIGETHAALGILEQIHQTKGVTISPALVPNSVHNAAAGYLSIGLKNHSPVLTVSQGWLSAESALVTAGDMLDMGLCDRILAADGDEADPAWADRLRALGDPFSADALENEAFEEGAAALVLGASPGERSLGTLTASVERWDKTETALRALLERRGAMPSTAASVHVRKSAFGTDLLPLVAAALDRPAAQILFDGNGPGTVQTGPLHTLIAAIRDKAASEVLLLGLEADEVGFVHWRRV